MGLLQAEETRKGQSIYETCVLPICTELNIWTAICALGNLLQSLPKDMFARNLHQLRVN